MRVRLWASGRSRTFPSVKAASEELGIEYQVVKDRCFREARLGVFQVCDA